MQVRKCGDCNMCCKLPEIPSINKKFESVQNRAVFTDCNISLVETCPVTYGYRIFFTFLYKNYDFK